MYSHHPISRRSLVKLAGAALVPAPVAFANAYPNKPIEVVVPASAGGGTDVVARAFAEVATKSLGQSVVVNNKPGASGLIGMQDVLNAKADGYKLCMGITELSILPHLGLMKFTHNDFRPVALLNMDASAVTVHADSPYKTIEDFIAAAKARPGTLNVGNSGNGSVWHLAAIGLEQKTGAKFTHVPFQGGNPGVLALLAKQLDAVTVSAGEVAAHVQAGKLRLLAVMGDKRAAMFPDAPTLKEKGIDFTVAGWRGLLAPKGTPDDVVSVLRNAARQASSQPRFIEPFSKLNISAVYLDAPEFAGMLTQTNDYFKGLISSTGFKL